MFFKARVTSTRVCWHHPSQPAAAVTLVCWNHPHLAGTGLCPWPVELQSGRLAGTARAAGPGSAAAGQRATARGLSASRGAGDVSGMSWVGTAPGHRAPVELHPKAPLETLGRGAAGAAQGPGHPHGAESPPARSSRSAPAQDEGTGQHLEQSVLLTRTCPQSEEGPPALGAELRGLGSGQGS